MLAIAGLVVLQGTIAAFLVEALLRLWRVQDPGERVALRWLALAAPLLLPIVFHFVAPARSSDSFGTSWAVFAGVHWNQPRLGGEGLASIATVLMMTVGSLLYLRDAAPFLDDRVRGGREHDARPDHPGAVRVQSLLDSLRASNEVRVRPRIVVLSQSVPVLLCTGVDRPALIVSEGTLARLTDEDLQAALAHEMAHVEYRDPLMSWLLMVVRTAAWFSPAAQIVGRQLVQEIEYRADAAVAREGLSAALGRAIESLTDLPGSNTDLTSRRRYLAFPRRMLEQAQRDAIGFRRDRATAQTASARSPIGGLQIALATMGVAALLFFVV